ncbi:hypothetical protein [Streptomyces sp. NBC_00203]|uniref:hypothetical protein n=1 Tax=Streptomyces sp. NBC_00203 TaxID=2975680 RepID=UPI00324B6E18
MDELLTEQLTAAERTTECLDITRETMLELAAEDGIEPPEPLPPGYREVLAAFEPAPDPTSPATRTQSWL